MSSVQARSAVVSVRTPGVLPTGDPPPRAGRHVDVVEPDRVVGDDPQAGTRRVEQLVVDAVGEQREEAIHAGDPPQQLVARRRQLVLPQVEGTCLADAARARPRG